MRLLPLRLSTVHAETVCYVRRDDKTKIGAPLTNGHTSTTHTPKYIEDSDRRSVQPCDLALRIAVDVSLEPTPRRPVAAALGHLADSGTEFVCSKDPRCAVCGVVAFVIFRYRYTFFF